MVNSGYAQNLSFGNETSYGSAAAINQSIGLVQSVSPTETNNLIKIRTLGGGRDYNNIVPGKFEVSGSFEYYLQGGSMLRMALGEDTGTTSGTIDAGPRVHATTASSTAYEHVMGSAASPTSECFPSFTLEFSDDESGQCIGTSGSKNLYRLYNGCKVNSLSISATVDDPVSVSVDWIGAGVSVSSAAATSVTQDERDPYVFYQGAVYCTSSAITGETSMVSDDFIAEANSFDFSVNNNLEPIWYVSGTTDGWQSLRGLKNLVVKGRDYEASLNMNFENRAMYDRFLGATGASGPQAVLNPYQIAFDFVRSGSIGGTANVEDDYIRVVLEGCKFNDTTIGGAPEDLVSQTMSVFVESAKVYVVDSDGNYKE